MAEKNDRLNKMTEVERNMAERYAGEGGGQWLRWNEEKGAYVPFDPKKEN